MADLTTVARPYAKALFDVARAEGQLEPWAAALNAAAAVLSEPKAKRVLANPTLDERKRAEFIRAVCVGLNGAEVFETPRGKALLALLAENDRLAVLPEIAAQFDALKREAEKRVKATMVSAVAVEPGVAERVKQALKKRLGREVDLALEVDPGLIGGAVIRAEDLVIDGSVRARLERLTQTLVS